MGVVFKKIWTRLESESFFQILLYLLLPFAKRYRSLKNRHKHTLLNKCNILEVKLWRVYFLATGASGDFHAFLLFALETRDPRPSNPRGCELDEGHLKLLVSRVIKNVFNSNWAWLAPMDIVFWPLLDLIPGDEKLLKGIFLGHQENHIKKNYSFLNDLFWKEQLWNRGME